MTTTATTTTTNGKTTVTFLHPRDSRRYRGEIGPGTTGKQVVNGLVKDKFIEAPGATKAYAIQIQRTGASIPMSASLVSSGVENDDVLAITETSAGA
jgi:hypothetical protein